MHGKVVPRAQMTSPAGIEAPLSREALRVVARHREARPPGYSAALTDVGTAGYGEARVCPCARRERFVLVQVVLGDRITS